MILWCVDPGTIASGFVLFETDDNSVLEASSSISNEDLRRELASVIEHEDHHLAIEMIASYGMPVGKEVFETVLWTGRFIEVFGSDRATKVYRKDVTMTLCGSMRAKDSNIRRALFDLFPATGGGATPQVGTKSKPGPLYGVSKHAISALAVGVTWRELEDQRGAA